MKQQHHMPKQAEIEDLEFDFSQLASIPIDASQDAEFEVLERGSDAHIAILEHALRDITETLAELKAAREAGRH